ncbi:aminopeptidase in chromosome III [Aphelenchoides avenae]|nr:aminopeptidase in chromosome III [Aphelenchus avenae]
MAQIAVSAGPNVNVGLPDAQVVIVGRHKHLKELKLEKELAQKLTGLDAKHFEAAIGQLQPASSVPLYLNLAKIISVPDTVSRSNTPSNSIAIFKELKTLTIANGVKALNVVLYADYDHVMSSVAAIARAFPTYTRKTAQKPQLEVVQLEVMITDGKTLSDADVNFLQSLSNSIREACRQVDAPCNEFHSDAFAEDAVRLVEATGAEISKTIIRGEDLKNKGFGGIYNVGKAARNPPIFACFSYTPKDATEAYALVGKGIVFDTGGMQLKGKTAMPSMKRDMGGAAAVLAAFCTLVRSGFKQNLHLLLCIAENNISPDANKPDDIITMLSGKSVEISNTDAEGRLVLADGVYYAKNTLKAKTIIDLATLTGAQSYASGKLIASVLSNKEEAEVACIRAGKKSGDLVHPLPYAPDLHFADLKSSVADMKNSNLGKMEGPPSAVAGLFIASHVDFSDDIDWIHVDIAAPAESGERATGFGASLVSALLAKHTDVGVAQ